MKRTLVLLAIVRLLSPSALAQHRHEVKTMKFKISGSVITLANPLEGPFSVLPIYAGTGNVGGITGSGFQAYQQLGPQGEMVCEAGQSAIRFDSTGDMLLLHITPGLSGTMAPGPEPGTFVWTQTWNGTTAGGTGRFAGATGTFTKTLTGFVLMPPGFVSPWEGTLAISLDRN